MVTSSPEDSKSDGLLDTLASPSRPMRHQKPILAALPRLTFVLVAFAAGAEATADSAPTYYFTTAAGRASIGRTDGIGEAARFNQPGGIAVDRAGNAYVADTGSHTIRKIGPDGSVSTFAGKAGFSGFADGIGSAARFWQPNAVAVDQVSNLIVADSGNNTIRKITPGAAVTTLAGTPGPVLALQDGPGSQATFYRPEGVTVDRDGNIFVADTYSSMIRRITPEGIVSTLQPVFIPEPSAVSNFWNTRFDEPEGVAADALGNVYVADTLLGGIRKIGLDGNVRLFAGDPRPGVPSYADGTGTAAHFFSPRGITVGGSGKIFVTDDLFQTIRQITPDAVVTTVAGAPQQPGDTDGPPNVARFNQPSGIAEDAAGNLLITESGNNVVRRITPGGIVSTFAGVSRFKSSGSADGAAAVARFYQPWGLASAPGGGVYIADRTNHTIRRLSATGEVRTIAGGAGSAGFVDGEAATARFSAPSYLTVDAAGNIYVADTGNNAIRKITPGGIVSTVAGGPGRPYWDVDGPIATAAFDGPTGLAVDTLGNLFVVDGQYESYARLRKVGVDGQVATIAIIFTRPPDEDGRPMWSGYQSGIALDPAGNVYAGSEGIGMLRVSPAGEITVFPLPFTARAVACDRAGNLFAVGGLQVAMVRPDGSSTVIAGGNEGSADGVGLDAQFAQPAGIAVDDSGNVYVSDGSIYANTIRKGVVAGPPVISQQPQGTSAAAGSNVQLSVSAGAVPDPTYQWYFQGNPINGAISNSYTLSNIQPAAAGEYYVTVTNDLASVPSNKAVVTVTAASVAVPPQTQGGGGSCEPWFVLALVGLGFGAIARRQPRTERNDPKGPGQSCRSPSARSARFGPSVSKPFSADRRG